MNKQIADDLFARLNEFLAHGPAKDLENLVRTAVKSGLVRMEMVSKEEFELLQSRLVVALDRIAALESRLSELEATGAHQKPLSDSE